MAVISSGLNVVKDYHKEACIDTKYWKGTHRVMSVEFTWFFCMTSSICGESSRYLKTASAEMFMKKALLISSTATIQTNIVKFYCLEEVNEEIRHATHCCCVTTLAQWGTTTSNWQPYRPRRWAHGIVVLNRGGCVKKIRANIVWNMRRIYHIHRHVWTF